MNVISLRIASTRGANKMPGSGDVEFSDGQSYGWLIHPLDGGVVFYGWRTRCGENERFSFRSARRALALRTELH